MDADERTEEQQTPSRARLTRRSRGKVVAGVCAGLGEHTGIDPVAFRIGFVLLTVMSGVGLVAYIVAAVLMPEDEGGDEPSGPFADLGDSKRWLALAAVLAGAALLADNLWPWPSGVLWGLLAIGAGLALWNREEPLFATSASAAPRPATVASAPAAPAPPRSEARRTSPLGRVAVGVAALVVGLSLIVENLGLGRPEVPDLLAVLLMVTGAGLVLGAWWGRARWLIVPGVLLTLALASLSVFPEALEVRGEVGDVIHRPSSLAELSDEYTITGGRLVLDLTDVPFGRRGREIDVRAGFGEVLVVLPEDHPVAVNARLGAGDLLVLGRESSGVGLRREVVDREGELARLELDIRVGVGEVQVAREGETR